MYCTNCKVEVVGDRKSCPLCQGMLTGDRQEEVFPKIPFVYAEHGVFLKVMLLISVIIASVSLALNILLPSSGAWSLFVLGGIGSAWISIISAINKRNNLPKNIVYQVIIISVIAVLWDLLTGWRGWSCTYVIPFVCFFAMISMAVISKIRNLYVEDYILYIVIDGLFGLVQIIFAFTGWLTALYPSLICIVTSVISLSFIMIFNQKELSAEIKRRLHI